MPLTTNRPPLTPKARRLTITLARPLEEELSGEAATADDPLAGCDVPAVAALFQALLRWDRL
ncbi:MAG: hypothetical protein HGA82_03125, partial [Anaerolineales bacterium]|nr:hypothetical protein [Anaerolineales bacterium]